MSTELGSPSPPDAKDALLQARDIDKASLALVEVQEQYDEVKDDRREERFLWICACVVLFDCAFLLNADNLAGPLIVGIIELLGLVILARRLGVEEVKELVFGLIDRINPNRD